MKRAQTGILAAKPRFSRYLFFDRVTDGDPKRALTSILDLAAEDDLVLGVGSPLASVGGGIDGLRPFPSLIGADVLVPSTQAALWCWLRADDDRGELVLRTRALETAFEPILRLDGIVDAFRYGGHDGDLGRDLMGYEDGTANPTGDAAVDAAVVTGTDSALDGSSFVAVQQWAHDLRGFAELTDSEADLVIGRERDTNKELEDAPDTAHVKRVEQESFDPEAFLLRQSMPWADAAGEGLMFVAFGHSLDAFDAQLRRMVGLEDGISDALLRFSRPVSGGYYWCPPTQAGRFDLSALDL